MACEYNVEGNAQAWRLRWGILAWAVALGMTVLFVRFDVPVWIRLAVFFPAALAASGTFSALYKVCPGLASKGMRETDLEGEVAILDPEARSHAKQQGRLVTALAVSAGVLTTATACVL